MAKGELQKDGQGLPSISRQDSQRILRMSEQGMSIDCIANVWGVETTEIVKTLESVGGDVVEDSGDMTARSAAATEQGFLPIVQRLMKDPEEFCCQISHQLMEDPVVAGDGLTYERSWIEHHLETRSTSPVTGSAINPQALNPNQHMKSQIISFKENTVQEILSLAPKLPCVQASELLDRAEEFVRPAASRDSAAKRKLASLLLIRVRMPARDAQHVNIFAEVIKLLFELEQHGEMLRVLDGMQEVELMTLLPQLHKETICLLHSSLQNEGGNSSMVELLGKELCCRMAADLGGDESLKQFWKLLYKHSTCRTVSTSSSGPMVLWLEAAAVVLATFLDRLPLKLNELDGNLLSTAQGYMNSKEEAVFVAKGFFNYDLGISTLCDWPPKGTASILVELASRLEDGLPDKLDLLVKAHCLDWSAVGLRTALKSELSRNISSGDGGPALESLLLKILLEDKQEIPEDVLCTFVLEENELKQMCPEMLLDLAQQMGTVGRRADGAKVAVLVSKLVAEAGDSERSCNAILRAFCMDRSNDDAAQGLVTAVETIQEENQNLKTKLQKCIQDISKLTKLNLKKFPRYRAKVWTCQGLTSMKRLEQRRLMSFVWDLSSYNFANFEPGQSQKSPDFKLPGEVGAYLDFYPRGLTNRILAASLFLHVRSAAKVEVEMSCGINKKQLEYDFSNSAQCANGEPQGRGFEEFCQSLEAVLQVGSIVLTVNSVQPPGSSIRYAS